MTNSAFNKWVWRCWQLLIRLSARPGLAYKMAAVSLLAIVVAQPPHLGSFYTYLQQAEREAHGGVLQVMHEFTRQVAHPFTPDPTAAPGSHAAKMTFRLTVPLLARVLHLGFVQLWLVQIGLGLGLVVGAYQLLREALHDRAAALLIAHGLCFTYFGYAAVYDQAVYFDAFGYAALIGAMWFRRPWAVAACTVAGAFTDERFVVALGIVVLWHGWRAGGGSRLPTLGQLLRTPGVLGAAAGVAAYVALRAALAVGFGLKTYTAAVGSQCLAYHLSNEVLPLGLLTGLESYWLLLAMGALAVAVAKRWRELGWLLAAVLPVVAVSLLVFDLTRSLAYATPAAILGAALARPGLSLGAARRLALVVWLGALLIPSYILSQTLVSAGSWSHMLLLATKKAVPLLP